MLSVYRASAGSGKTFTLAKDYIKLLISVKRKDSEDDRLSTYELNLDRSARRMLMPYRHRAILAITFTHKATEEMKTRILGELRTLADPAKKSDYQAEFMADLHCSRRELAAAADLALRQILYDYHNFNVSTIDSYFQRVLHTFARELDHQSDYSVELSQTAAMAQAVGTMLDDFNSSHYTKSPELEAWLYDYLSDQVDQGSKANFFNRNSKVHTDLVKLMSSIGQESFKEFSADMRAYLADPRRINDFTDSLRGKILGIPAIIRKEIEPLITLGDADHLKNSRPDLRPLARTALEGRMLNKEQRKQLEGKTIDKIINGDKAYQAKSHCCTPAGNEAASRAFGIIRARYRQMETLRKLLDCMPMLGLLAHTWRYLDELTRENNILLISDTNDLVSRIIGHDKTPFIYERMGVKLSHFLIDEFQDTSRLQWANLEPLVANGLSTGDDSLVIGDEKQSIYRFRNSDSSILHSQIEQSLGDYIDPDAEAKRKNVNWRSSERVVRFNNTLFSIINEKMKVDGYDRVAQRVSPKHRLKTLNPFGERGYARFIETVRGNPSKENQGCLKAKSDDVLHMMAAEIIRQHDQGGYDWKDIAVLVDSNAEATLVVSFLIDNYFGKIKVLSDEALKLASSPAVQLVISTMKIIDAEGSAAAAAEGKRMSQSQIALALSRYEYFLSQDSGSSDPGRHSRALRQALSPSEQAMGHSLLGPGAERPASILAMAELIVARHFSADERKRHFSYLAALCDVIVEFSSLHSGSLHEFLEWWDANCASLAITGTADADAVKVMTVHKSKGLEFDCVLIPFCNWELHWSSLYPPQVWTKTPDLSDLGLALPPPAMFITIEESDSRPDAMFHQAYADELAKSLADNINKTYVAFTRAKSELIVWYTHSNSIIGSAIKDAFAAGTPAAFDPETMLDLAPCSVPKDEIKGTPPPASEFVLGEPTVKAARPDNGKSRATTIEASYPVSTSSKTRAVLAVASALGADDSCIAEAEPDSGIDPEDIADAPDEASRTLGIMLHEVMALTRRSADLPKAASRVARASRLSPDESRQLESIARRTLEINPGLTRRWFDTFAKVRIEQPIYAPSPDIVRRPDRVVFCPDGSVDVIDYKFTARPERLGAPSHLAQVREYMSLHADMGCRPVRGYLVYPQLGAILPVTPSR